MRFFAARAKLPSPLNVGLAVLSAVLLTLAFPDFDLWLFAWFALVPLFYAIEREKQSTIKSFVVGWIFGICFFFFTCWWLTFAPVTYGGVPASIAYLLLFFATGIVGFFSAIFAAFFSILLRRFGVHAFLAAPFLWTATEFLRFNLTGNNWNAIGYSQAFRPSLIETANLGGVYLIGFLIVCFNALIISNVLNLISESAEKQKNRFVATVCFVAVTLIFSVYEILSSNENVISPAVANIVAIQPNVPMSGLKYGEWEKLRDRHVALAENALQKIKEQKTNENLATTIIFPESPMNFEYESDRDLQKFLRDFAVKNNASILFNSAQPNTGGTNFFNSAVMINAQGNKIGQYDKIHLVPFGETVPLPAALAQFVPTMVGNFETGDKYDLLPFGDAKGGVMICFESHFASLSREYASEGADFLVEMTNDGYLGDTPILRQHLANAVFRAVETNRPLVRVTNVGITAYINERGEISDAANSYTEDVRIWTVSKSDGVQTIYVRFGDWFAWLCSIASLVLLFWGFWKRKLYRGEK